MHLIHLATLSCILYNKPVNMSKLFSWVLWAVLVNLRREFWESPIYSSHKASSLGLVTSISIRGSGTESFNWDLTLTPARQCLNWITGYAVGIQGLEDLTASSKLQGAEDLRKIIPPSPKPVSCSFRQMSRACRKSDSSLKCLQESSWSTINEVFKIQFPPIAHADLKWSDQMAGAL